MRLWILIVMLCSLAKACSSESKSPEFDPNSTVRIKGQILAISGEPLANTGLELRNLRFFGYASIINPYVPFLNWSIIRSAFWYFPAYRKDFEEIKETPGYFISRAATDAEGYYNFRIKAGNLLRDENGGINIVLTNKGDDASESFMKHGFVVKQQDTELGAIRLCDLGPFSVLENSNDVTLNWVLPEDTVTQFVIKVADDETNGLLWASQVEGTVTSLVLPKTIFSAATHRIVIEASYRVEDEINSMCLTPSQSLSLSAPVVSLGSDLLFAAEGIKFPITSLTNGSFNDKSYFEAFDVTELSLDLQRDVSFQAINFHNILGGSATLPLDVTISCSSNAEPDDFDQILARNQELTRFYSMELSEVTTCRMIKFVFSETIQQLQEVTLL